ncbi:dimethylamine monooxygenase subunit DmmA family protein [Vreelandella arctica]|uniref:dimethylamine monooxygenase subunit DmmA family protein n=1 Tax=Vreelandella arctica TaxID=3126499 RepID=UPI003D66F71A
MQHNVFPADNTIKSRPVYVAPEYPATANRYICLAEPSAVGLIMAHLAPVNKHLIPVHLIVCTDSTSADQDAITPEQDDVLSYQRCGRDDLPAMLAAQLNELTLGCHVIAAGSEAFLWDVHTLAMAQGLLEAEITLLPSEDKYRRVFCAHCRFLNEPVSVSPTQCQGCGLTLEVRDHFSRRLGAYMGVCIDAEVPGEVPSEEVLD